MLNIIHINNFKYDCKEHFKNNTWRQITNEKTQAMVGPSPEGYEGDAEIRVH